MILTVTSQICAMLQVVIICAVMPTAIVLLLSRAKTRTMKERSELAKFALEKNPNLDMEEFLSKLTPQKKTATEKNIINLLIGCIFSFVGLAGLVFYFIISAKSFEEAMIVLLFASVVFAVGVAFLTSYFAVKSLIAKGKLK